MPDTTIGAAYLADVLRHLTAYKKLAEDAIAQVSDADLFRQIDPEANSIAMLVKHVAGNMRSRWTNFLTSDGEKPERRRDEEFVIDGDTTRRDVMSWWEDGWKRTLDAIAALEPEQLLATVTIRGEEHTVLRAVNRQLTHYAGHIDQLVLLAKHFRGADWKSLSIPRARPATEPAKPARG